MAAEPTAPSYYVTALDRVGLALLAGGALSGLASIPLASGDVAAVMGVWAVATVVALATITLLAAPLWMLLHRRGIRSPGAAATLGAMLAAAIAIVLQLWGTNGGTYRWVSAVATAVPVALFAAAVALVMQAIAYRRLF